MVSLASLLEKKKEKTELILKNVFNLPPVPKAIQEVLDLLDNPNTLNSQLSHVIATDQGLVTKILTIANSPLFGLQRRVTTIDFALLVLGHRELQNIISVLSVVESFKNKTDQYLDQKTFWMHSFLTGTASRRLAEDLDFSNNGEAFIAGFLHDVGLSIIHRFMHSNFLEIFGLVKHKGMNYQEAELEVLGMTHEQVGHYLFEKWNFPGLLCDTVLHHHNPENAKGDKTLSSIVHLADYMAYKFSNGEAYWDKNLQINLSELSNLGIRSMEEADKFIDEYKELFINQISSVRYLN
jgi:HD-like signal output (HDOD) protein